MENARNPRAAMRLSMLPLAALALAASPANAMQGGGASPAALAIALTPAASAALMAMPDGTLRTNKAVNSAQRTRAVECPAAPVMAAAPATLSKAEFILKGAPSKLEQMRMAQAGITAPAASAATAPVMAMAPVAEGKAYPASPLPTGALVAMPAPRACLSILTAVKRADVARPATTAAMPLDRYVDPDAEFGSRAMRVNRTRFDGDWARVTRDPQHGLLVAKLRDAGISAAAGEGELFKQVNNWVNRQIGYANDDINYRRADYWATPAETIARGRGDCEDFAILKMQMLRAAGFDAGRMKLVLLRDLVGGGDHAVLLVVDQNGQRLVLDNTTDRVYDGSRGDYFRPIFSYGTSGHYIHGFDTRGALAAASRATAPDTAKRAPVRLAMLDQRSVNAEFETFKTGLSK